MFQKAYICIKFNLFVLKYLKSTQLSAFLLLGIIYLILKLPLLSHLEQEPIIIQTFSVVSPYIYLENSLWAFIIAQIINIAQAIWINFLFSESTFVRVKTIIPAYLFILLSSTVISYNFINIYHLIFTVLLGLYQIFLKISFKEQARTDIFNVGVLFGFLIILFPNSILITPILMLIIYLLKPLKLREIFLVLIGILCIPYFYFAIMYLMEIKLVFPFNFYIYLPSIFNIDFSTKIILLLIAISSIISIWGMIGIKQSTENRVKRNVDMLYLLSIGLFLVIIFSTYYFPDTTLLIFLSSTLFLSIFLHRIKNQRVAEILNFFLFIGTIIFCFYKNYQ